jgi:mannose-6-phosphate isomerase-like protein (cupin superfamily)
LAAWEEFCALAVAIIERRGGGESSNPNGLRRLAGYAIPKYTEENSSMSRVRKPVRIVPKGWGREVWIANGKLYCGKILEINKGKRCSLHYHKLKTESFYLRAGRLMVRIKESPQDSKIEEFEMDSGDCMDIRPGLVHQMEALEDAELYEFSTQHFDSDSHRIAQGD